MLYIESAGCVSLAALALTVVVAAVRVRRFQQHIPDFGESAIDFFFEQAHTHSPLIKKRQCLWISQ